MAEHEVVVVPVFAGGEPFGRLALAVGSQRGDGAFGQDEGAAGLGRLGVATSARRAPDVNDSFVEVEVIPAQAA